MKIIKNGSLNKINKIKRFKCEKCGCLFQATKNEYKIASQYNQEYVYCECPFCHKTVYGAIHGEIE